MQVVIDPPGVRIAAADHPSLDTAVAEFAARLRAEPRYFGRLDGSAPKPFPSLIARVCSRESGFRIAALYEGRVIGLARVDDRGEVYVVVAAAARGRGLGLALARAVVERARADGRTRLVLRSSRRSRAALALGVAMGFVAVDLGRGRVDLILDLGAATSSA
jgi:GNAT superfamily N-acetyltransferase